MADEDTPLDREARHMRFTAEPLSSLLKSYRLALLRDQWDAAQAIETAIYKAREAEIAKLVELAKAPKTSESEGR